MPTIASLASTNGSYRLLPNTFDKVLAFDIETDGLLYSKESPVSKAWCIVIFDCKEKRYYEYTPDNIGQGLEHLSQATILIGHNIISYDIPVLQYLYPQWKSKAQVIDTFTLASLVYPKDKLLELDTSIFAHIDKNLRGRQSLKAWGQRLQNLKGDHSDWSQFSKEMLSYCKNDVLVTIQLYTYLVNTLKQQDPNLTNTKFVALEHDLAQILMLQMSTGWTFDVDAAIELDNKLRSRLNEITAELEKTIPPTVERTVFVPKRDNKTKGYLKGLPVIREKVIPFNPGSRQQILQFFRDKYNWQPKEKTEKGNYKVNDDILEDLEYPEAKLLAEYFLLQKRLGQLSDGNKSWLGLVDQDNIIHGSIVSSGCVTGRSIHRDPNLGQVPNAGAPYGPECRSLFKPTDGFMLLGSDAKALELRCLGGYLAHYDNGDYASKVIDPDVDIHTYNQEKFGVETRDLAKRLIYCVPVDNTQILTESGLKYYNELSVGDIVLTYNRQSNEYEWKPILHIVKPYEDNVYELTDNCYFKTESTANHRWFFKDSNETINVTTTEDINETTEILIFHSKITGNSFTYPKINKKYVGRKQVFCISTENESFVMRQGECITITGNCVLYGGGPTKTGSIIAPNESPDYQRQIGIKTLDNFYKEIPALKHLKDDVETTINNRGYLKGLDGRELYVRSAYKGLNLLLQSAGAIIMKRVGVEIYEGLTQAGLEYGIDWTQNAYVHDEYQNSVLKHHVEIAKEIILASYLRAGQFLDFKCPIEGDVKVGTNWYETH